MKYESYWKKCCKLSDIDRKHDTNSHIHSTGKSNPITFPVDKKVN